MKSLKIWLKKRKYELIAFCAILGLALIFVLKLFGAKGKHKDLSESIVKWNVESRKQVMKEVNEDFKKREKKKLETIGEKEQKIKEVEKAAEERNEKIDRASPSELHDVFDDLLHST